MVKHLRYLSDMLPVSLEKPIRVQLFLLFGVFPKRTFEENAAQNSKSEIVFGQESKIVFEQESEIVFGQESKIAFQ